MINGNPSREEVDQMANLMRIINESSTITETHMDSEATGHYNVPELPQPEYVEEAVDPIALNEAIQRVSASGNPNDSQFLEMWGLATPAQTNTRVEAPRENIGLNSRPTAQSFTQPLRENNTAPVARSNSTYRVKTTLVESTKSKVNRFAVERDGVENVVENIVVKEAGEVIAKLLESGRNLYNAKITEMIDLDYSYHCHRLNASTNKSRMTQSLELGEEVAAGVFSKRFEEATALATATLDEIKNAKRALK